MEVHTVTAWALVAFYVSWCEAVLCPAGSYVFSPRNGILDVCVPCMKGVGFMPEDNHDKRRCYDCTQIRGYPEVLVSACNRTHDAEILCSEGYYRSKTNKSCVKCYSCDQPTRPCQGYHNTLCCGKPDSEAVLDEAGFYVCKDRSVQCGPGQFYSTTKDKCERCPPGTYMSFQTHVNTACWKCPVQSSDPSMTHSVILQECNRTSPTLFGCQQGYFRDPDQHELSVEVTCTRCQTCQYPGRTCDVFHDTVCCPGPDMIVSDMEDEFKHVEKGDQNQAQKPGGPQDKSKTYNNRRCRKKTGVPDVQTDEAGDTDQTEKQPTCLTVEDLPRLCSNRLHKENDEQALWTPYVFFILTTLFAAFEIYYVFDHFPSYIKIINEIVLNQDNSKSIREACFRKTLVICSIILPNFQFLLRVGFVLSFCFSEETSKIILAFLLIFILLTLISEYLVCKYDHQLFHNVSCRECRREYLLNGKMDPSNINIGTTNSDDQQSLMPDSS